MNYKYEKKDIEGGKKIISETIDIQKTNKYIKKVKTVITKENSKRITKIKKCLVLEPPTKEKKAPKFFYGKVYGYKNYINQFEDREQYYKDCVEAMEENEKYPENFVKI